MLLVRPPGKNLSHIILEHGSEKALCDRTCWPGKWEDAAVSDGNPLCVTCLRIWQSTPAQVKGKNQ